MSKSWIVSRCVSAVIIMLAVANAARAQPSDPAGFGTVFNIGTVEPGSVFDVADADIPGTLATGASVGDGDFFLLSGPLTPSDLTGDILGSDSQLNLFDAGTISPGFIAGPTDGTGDNVEVNITGGLVGDFFFANPGSTVNVTGGSVGSFFDANPGSTVNIAGGSVGSGFNADTGSTVNITGGSVGISFFANSGSTVNLSGGSVGSSFDAGAGSSLIISGGEFELNGEATTDLSEGLGIEIFNTDLFTGVLADGNVFIFAGEDFDDFAPGTTTLQTVAVAASTNPGVLSAGVFSQGVRPGETLTVNGVGELNDGFAVVQGTLNIDAGAAGDGLEVAFGQVNITGGSVGVGFNAFAGSTVNVSGGSVGDAFDANAGSTVNLSGGRVGSGFEANSGSTVNLSGGNIGSSIAANTDSTVNLIGGEFQLNGAAASDLSAGFGLGFPSTDLLTGVLADGSVFIFAGEAGDSFELGTTTLQSVAVAPSINPGVLTSGSFAQGVRTGESLTVSGTGQLSDNFAVVGGTLNIDAGSVGDGLEVAFGEVNIAGGSVADGLSVFAGSELNITGGSVGFFNANSGSTVNLAGGSIEDGFSANAGSTINLTGTQFLLDGLEIADLVLNEPFTIVDPFFDFFELTGLLADGSAFAFDLESVFFDPDATLTVTLVEAGLSGDFNDDTVVNIADFVALRDGAAPGAGFADFVANFGALSSAATTATAIPEPGSVLLLLASLATGPWRRRR